MDRVEQVVRSLPGVVSARAQATDDGELEAIHVLVSDHMPRYRITRAIHSALLIYLDLAIDDHQIEVAVAEEAPPETNGPGGADDLGANDLGADDLGADHGTVDHGTADHGTANDDTAAEADESVPEAGEEPVETARVNGATAPREPAGPDAAAPDRPEASGPTPEREREAEHPPLAPPVGSGGASTSFADAEGPDDPAPAADDYGSRPAAGHATSDAGGPEAGRRETPERAAPEPTGTRSDPAAADPAGPEERPSDRPSAAPRRDEGPAPAAERIRIRPARTLSLRGYGIRSGGSGGVRVRVEVETERGSYRGEVPAPDLDSLSLEIFAEAATIAAERGLAEDFPALRRPGLRVLGIEKTRAVGNVHLAVSVSGYMDDGSRTATGFAAVERDTHRAAALAALDAIERLLREEPGGAGAPEPDRGDDPEFDPFGPWSRDS